ncbi:LOW QUALITY PROTEIN: hypothetical protein TorRG33x02_308560 [Trema orientale]|uniref:Uncharacterized protein n=1 Tax=Trema orientale TaxID=63057 RepID=A0A2P5BU51_TREOI|nr:LOW QUALITY PROTEIN: hypothetical protein TorRG33x02_308560 [Trema orientale]
MVMAKTTTQIIFPEKYGIDLLKSTGAKKNVNGSKGRKLLEEVRVWRAMNGRFIVNRLDKTASLFSRHIRRLFWKVSQQVPVHHHK